MLLVLRAAVQKFRFIDPMGGYVLLPARMDALATGMMNALLVSHQVESLDGRER